MPIVQTFGNAAARAFGFGLSSAASYELISTTLISSPTGNFTLSSIPQGYKHLQMRITMRLDGATVTNSAAFDFVNGTQTYSQHYLQNSGTSVASSGNSSIGIINFPEAPAANGTANVFMASIVDILDYTSTTKNKTVRMLSGYMQDTSYDRIDLRSGAQYDSATPITSIRLRPYGAANFVAGSRFSLYGVRG